MLFNLGTFLNSNEDLRELETPFTKIEIDQVITDLPNNRSLGPDGFNNEFLKGFWPLIADDFYRLFHHFCNSSICLRGLNSSYITLIPKKEGPSTTSDYRPISLLNTSLKLLTKVLANRLQKVIKRLIHGNQYGFIKTRRHGLLSTYAFAINPRKS